MAKIAKTHLCIEVTNSEWSLDFNGSLEFPQKDDKVAFKHDERIMRALVSDKRLFQLFYRLVEPARRFYLREARKKKQSSNQSSNERQ